MLLEAPATARSHPKYCISGCLGVPPRSVAIANTRLSTGTVVITDGTGLQGYRARGWPCRQLMPKEPMRPMNRFHRERGFIFMIRGVASRYDDNGKVKVPYTRTYRLMHVLSDHGTIRNFWTNPTISSHHRVQSGTLFQGWPGSRAQVPIEPDEGLQAGAGGETCVIRRQLVDVMASAVCDDAQDARRRLRPWSDDRERVS